MGITAALEEIARSSPPALPADRVALARLDSLIVRLEELNLKGVGLVPIPLHLEIVSALGGLISMDVNVPASPSKALDLVFAGQARILRGIYPEYQDEFDDE